MKNNILILDNLRTLVFAESGISCCQQHFHGWPNNQSPSNKDPLSKFNFPSRFKLNLTVGNEDMNQELNGRYIYIHLIHLFVILK